MTQMLATKPRRHVQTLQVAYTPDSDDVFNYYAWEHGRLGLQTCDSAVTFHQNHIHALNESARQQRYDIVAISSVIYPQVAEHYAILASGNSIGRGYGPVLVSDRYHHLHELRNKRVGIAGRLTTGGCLAMMYCPGETFIECTYDTIADRIKQGDFDAGVMIHEELLHYPAKGLHKIADLGLAWCDDTRLPLPVGLNLVSRNLSASLQRDIAATCRRSLQWAHAHFDEAFECASQYGRGCAKQHVAMFSNEDTVKLPADARQSLKVMFARMASMGLTPRINQPEIIDG